MAFPAGPYTDGQTHTEAGVNYTYSSATGAWVKVVAAGGGGNVPDTRSLTGVNSIAGGGNLTADRTFQLVNDVASPGTLRYYGTNSSGVRGWHSIAPVQQSTTINTTGSVTGGGNLSANRTLQLVNDAVNPGDNLFYGTNAAGVKGWVQQSPNVPATRSITGTQSITGGGDLTADRTISLVNDSAAPGAFKMYGTDVAGVRGWFDAPRPVTYSGGSLVVPQTIAAGGFFQLAMVGSGITASGDTISLLANVTYTIDVGTAPPSGGAALKLKLVNRTSSTDLVSFTGATTFVFKPTVNTNISLQNADTVSVSGINGNIAVVSA